ncbi:unnamed protein product [Paramecium sonneborni]|uniref:Uncharacterized protein n=1 Tax=Paramecium sonneborni TaxID=65129 RepID=A0A8S1LGC6_9CILI|nr:unnamed protein product [Paramecium sonneborni]
MKDCNISFQNKPTIAISRIYQNSDRFHLPNLNKTKSQSPNNIYYNEYFTEVRGIKANSEKSRQIQDKIIKNKIKGVVLKKKQQKLLSNRYFYQEENLKRIVNNQSLEPQQISKKVQASKIIISKIKNELYYSQSIPPIKCTLNQKEEKEIRKPRYFYEGSIKEKLDRRQKVSKENKDEQYNYWKYSYQDEYEDEDSIIEYVSGQHQFQ